MLRTPRRPCLPRNTTKQHTVLSGHSPEELSTSTNEELALNVYEIENDIAQAELELLHDEMGPIERAQTKMYLDRLYLELEDAVMALA